MPSLSVHLQLPEDHSGLPFHPSCPVCRRDRLAGSLSGDELVSRRTQAAIATGLLAFSGIGAPVAAASEPDSVSEGTAEVIDGAGSGEFDVGGTTVELPEETTQSPGEAPPLPDIDEDAAPLEEAGDPGAAELVVEPAEEVTDVPADPPPISQADPVPPPAETPAAAVTPEDGDIRSEASKRVRVSRERPAKNDGEASQAVVVAEPAPVDAPPPAAPAAVRVVAGASGGHASPGDRVHTVRRGESLWSIASDLLGDGTGAARVAQEVNRLWTLNEDRISSGSPDLLYTGTRLKLR